MFKRLLLPLLAITVLAAACGDDDATPVASDADSESGEDSAPMTGPAAIGVDDQSGDGTTVVVASVSLPSDGFVVVHADADGGPGPVLGWSDLLSAGDSAAVVVTLNTALDADTTVWTMAHVDANGNGEYEFMPPDVVIDIPATTADDAVAVLPIAYTIG